MKYPIFTVYPTKKHDQIEYTASSILPDGSVDVYVEVPKEDIGSDFAHLTYNIPSCILKESYGFTEDEKDKILDRIRQASDIILDHVKEEEGELCNA